MFIHCLLFDDDIYENKFLGGASIWWLENSLSSLNLDIGIL